MSRAAATASLVQILPEQARARSVPTPRPVSLTHTGLRRRPSGTGPHGRPRTFPKWTRKARYGIPKHRDLKVTDLVTEVAPSQYRSLARSVADTVPFSLSFILTTYIYNMCCRLWGGVENNILGFSEPLCSIDN